jgi:signal transduction histidine kinase
LAPANLTEAIRATVIVAASEYKMVAELILDLCELPLVTCHLGEINQVVLNLVINAAHAIADAVRGTTQRGRLVVCTRRQGDDVVISVSDTGAGIPEAVRDRIFDPFFTTKEVGRGTGQGLGIARSIVCEMHHGQIAFETELGKGTTFHVRLPISQRR